MDTLQSVELMVEGMCILASEKPLLRRFDRSAGWPGYETDCTIVWLQSCRSAKVQPSLSFCNATSHTVGCSGTLGNLAMSANLQPSIVEEVSLYSQES